MAKVTFQNTGRTTVHCGSVSVAPGAMRMVEESDIPAALRPAGAPQPAAQAPAADPIRDLAALGAKKLIPEIQTLNAEQLEQLATYELERGDAARTSVLTAIDARRLALAQQSTAGGNADGGTGA